VSSPTASRMLLGIAASIEHEQELGCEPAIAVESALADEAVMARVQSGDQEALGLLFDRYSRLVLSVGLRILRDQSEAEELVQDVFLYVFNKCASFDPQKSYFRSWLVQIAYCRAFDKREYLINRRFYDYRNIDEIIESVRSNVCLEASLERAELRKLFEAAFAELTERQRTTLELFFFQGYSLREISSQMDETLAATRHHYYRSLEKLKSAGTLASTLEKNGRRNGK
jgi:RNA polymerase sigma-70 factor (ECF subfamily)